MKKISLLLLLTFPILTFANDQELKICLTGSTEKALPKYGEAFVNGAYLALRELPENQKRDVKLEVYYYDSNPLAPIEKLNEMRKNACDAIIGFSTGNDLLAIEENLKINPVFTLSIYGDPQDRFNETTYLKTMQPSANDLVGHLFKHLPFQLNKKSKVLVVTAVDRSEMISYKEAYLSLLKKKTANIKEVEVIEQTHDLRQFNEVIAKDPNWDYVVLLTRSLVAAEISDLIHLKSNPILLGTKYFGSSELPAFWNYLKNKNVQAYFSRQNCSCDSSANNIELKNKYILNFNVSPMSISIDSYDATKFILKGLNIAKRNPETLIQFLNTKKANFLGISSLKVTEGKLSSSRRFLINVDKEGYKEVK